MEYIKMQIPKKEKSHFSEFAFTTAAILLAIIFTLACLFLQKKKDIESG